jgi:predicted RNA-binding Zn-ribbon protein involved in translation (DUF1610 family)
VESEGKGKRCGILEKGEGMKIVEMWLCLSCEVKISSAESRLRKDKAKKCPKCGQMMGRTVVLV